MTSIYSKDSFDRFGDDLCEEILSYFPLEDRIKYECLSQQWKRTAYQRVNKLVFYETNSLSEKLISKESTDEKVSPLESLFAKCPNITHLYFDPNWMSFISKISFENIFGLITKYCPHLRSIDNSLFVLNQDLAQTLFEKIGQQVVSLVLYNFTNFEKLNSERFVKLRRLNIYYMENVLDHLFDGSDSLSFPIRRLSHLKMSYNDREENELRSIIRSNKELKHLEISCFSSKLKSLEDLLTDLLVLRQLKTLIIDFSYSNAPKILLEKFKIIAKKCTLIEKLVVFDSHNSFFHEPSDEYLGLYILTIVKEFPNLVHLELNVIGGKISWKSRIADQLGAKCPKLRHLKLVMDGMVDMFFQDIHEFLPNLKHLSICEMNKTESFVNYIKRLKYLQSVVIFNVNFCKFSQFTNSDVNIPRLFRVCIRLKSIHLRICWQYYNYLRNYEQGVKQPDCYPNMIGYQVNSSKDEYPRSFDEPD